MAVPTGLLTASFSIIIYDNVMEMFEWANKIYRYYVVLFQVILPVIILIVAEIKTRIQKSKNKTIAQEGTIPLES